MDYCYSTNEEEFNFTEKYDILDHMRACGNLVVGAKFWRGVPHKNSPSSYFNVDSLVDDINERACDEVGEYAENFMYGIEKYKIRELETLINNWIDTNVSVDFYQIINVKEITVTQEMINQYKLDSNEGE